MKRMALLTVAALAVAAAALWPGGSGRPKTGTHAVRLVASPAPARVPLTRLVGAKVVGAVDGTAPSRALLRRVRRGELGGVVLSGTNVASGAQLRGLTRRLRRAARAGGAAGFLIAIDQEGGSVRRLAGPPRRSPVEIGRRGSRRVARGEGRATGRLLRRLGIGVDLAPVLDVGRRRSFMASRAFGRTPRRVARLGPEFAVGLQQRGTAATAKHFPGLGLSG